MAQNPVRVGIVGAGNNTRVMHIPRFQGIDNVEIVSICNRSRESSERVAKEFGIPKIYEDWTELVDADDTNAICIGTWPYMHCPMTLRALSKGKHVLTEARMAMDATESHAMLNSARQHPNLVTQIVPFPYTLKVDKTVINLITEGYLGNLLAVELRANQSIFPDLSRPMWWRDDRDVSGYNILVMGMWYEALMRWLGPATKVTAMTKTAIHQRKDDQGILRSVSVPDHADILCEMACGAQARLLFSNILGLAPQGGIWIFGDQGTLHLDISTMELSGGQRGDEALKPITIPTELEGKWRVEEEFINAIRGEEKITHTTFEDGVKYMEFTEAVTRSAQSGRAVNLPL